MSKEIYQRSGSRPFDRFGRIPDQRGETAPLQQHPVQDREMLFVARTHKTNSRAVADHIESNAGNSQTTPIASEGLSKYRRQRYECTGSPVRSSQMSKLIDTSQTNDCTRDGQHMENRESSSSLNESRKPHNRLSSLDVKLDDSDSDSDDLLLFGTESSTNTKHQTPSIRRILHSISVDEQKHSVYKKKTCKSLTNQTSFPTYGIPTHVFDKSTDLCQTGKELNPDVNQGVCCLKPHDITHGSSSGSNRDTISANECAFSPQYDLLCTEHVNNWTMTDEGNGSNGRYTTECSFAVRTEKDSKGNTHMFGNFGGHHNVGDETGSDSVLNTECDSPHIMSSQGSRSGSRYKAGREAKPSFLIQPRRQYIEQGSVARFKASCEGVPPPAVTWERDGRQLSHSAKYQISQKGSFHCLDVLDVTGSDVGCYMCVITNSLGSQSSSANLDLFTKPKARPQHQRTAPQFEQRLRDVTVGEGATAKLSCVVSGQPKPFVQWNHEGKMLRRIPGVEEEFDDNTASLTFSCVSSNNAGTYECVASNAVNVVRNECVLTVIEKTAKGCPNQNGSYEPKLESKVTLLVAEPKLNKVTAERRDAMENVTKFSGSCQIEPHPHAKTNGFRDSPHKTTEKSVVETVHRSGPRQIVIPHASKTSPQSNAACDNSGTKTMADDTGPHPGKPAKFVSTVTFNTSSSSTINFEIPISSIDKNANLKYDVSDPNISVSMVGSSSNIGSREAGVQNVRQEAHAVANQPITQQDSRSKFSDARLKFGAPLDSRKEADSKQPTVSRITTSAGISEARKKFTGASSDSLDRENTGAKGIKPWDTGRGTVSDVRKKFAGDNKSDCDKQPVTKHGARTTSKISDVRKRFSESASEPSHEPESRSSKKLSDAQSTDHSRSSGTYSQNVVLSLSHDAGAVESSPITQQGPVTQQGPAAGEQWLEYQQPVVSKVFPYKPEETVVVTSHPNKSYDFPRIISDTTVKIGASPQDKDFEHPAMVPTPKDQITGTSSPLLAKQVSVERVQDSIVKDTSKIVKPVHVQGKVDKEPAKINASFEHPTQVTLPADRIKLGVSLSQEDSNRQPEKRTSGHSVDVVGDLDRRQSVVAPVFVKRPKSSIVKEGESTEISVHMKGDPKPDVTWMRDGKPISNGRNIKLSEANGVCSLLILKAEMNDAGRYLCQISNAAGKEKCSANINVTAANTPGKRNTEKTDFRNLLKNKAQKNPSTDCGKSQVTTPSGGKQLDFRGVLKKRPTVVDKPRFVVYLDDKEVIQGEKVTFEVKVMGSPPPKITWCHGPMKIKDTEFHRVTSYHAADHVFAKLVITEARPDHAGSYSCRAENEAGFYESSCTLLVNEIRARESSVSRGTVPSFDSSQVRSTSQDQQDPSQAPNSEISNNPELSSDPIQTPEGSENQDPFSDDFASENPESTRPESRESVLSSESKDSDLSYDKHASLDHTPPEELQSRKHSSEQSQDSLLSPTEQPPPIPETPVPTDESAEVPLPSSGSEPVCTPTEECKSPHRLTRQEEVYTYDIPQDGPVAAPGSPGTAIGDEPPMLVNLVPQAVNVLKGRKVSLKGTFVGNPSPNVRWFLDESRTRNEIHADDRISIENKKGATTLVIAEALEQDTGIYTLEISNELGRNQLSSSITIEDKPDPPVNQPFVSNIRNNSLDLSWYGSGYDGGTPIIHYKVEMNRDKASDWLTLTDACKHTAYNVVDLEPNQGYEFRISAGNRHGFGSPSKCSDLVYTMEHQPSEQDEDELPFDPRDVMVKSDEKFQDAYILGEQIGRGKFGCVYKCTDKSTGRTYASKFIKTTRATQKVDVQQEVDVMNSLHHPKLLLLWDAFQSRREIILVMEHIRGGELLNRVVDEDYILTERECVHFMRQICDGVRFMHKNNIVHLDLKPENVMCITSNSNEIKIIDFGLARQLDPTKDNKVMFGTAEFVAPEVVNYDAINYGTDMWSVGVICYILLSGLSPFAGDNDAETFSNVTVAQYDFDTEEFDAISEDAKQFIERLLKKSTKERMNATECLSFNWLAQDVKYMKAKRLSTEKHKRFLNRMKWRKAKNAVEVINRMQKTLSRASMFSSTKSTGSLESSPSRESYTESFASESSSSSGHRSTSESIDKSPKGSTELPNGKSEILPNGKSDTLANGKADTHPSSKSESLAGEKGVDEKRSSKLTGSVGENSNSSFDDDKIYQLPTRRRDWNGVRIKTARLRSTNSLDFDFNQNESPRKAEPPVLLARMKDFEVFEGDNAKFEIRLENAVSAKVTWYKDGLILFDNEEKYVFKSDEEFGTYALVIKTCSQDDGSEYGCLVSNAHGESKCSACLHVEGD